MRVDLSDHIRMTINRVHVVYDRVQQYASHPAITEVATDGGEDVANMHVSE